MASSSTEDNFVVIDDDDFIIVEDDENEENILQDAWKLALVDDDPNVHQATMLALSGLQFAGKPIMFIVAESGKEAKELLKNNPDTAAIFLDVVMETNHAGLDVVRYIREELENRKIQIILRTGQPGEAPEEAVIIGYAINDYKLKIDLTRQKLVTTTIAALRAYQNVITIEQQAEQIEQALVNLQAAQLQLVQNEKMATLGNLISGVAHEINNPVGFIAGNISAVKEYVSDVLHLFDRYRQECPPTPQLVEEIEEIDFEFVREDLPKTIESMQTGCDRIFAISQSLRTLSRHDRDSKQEFDLQEGLDSTLLILKYRLKANTERPAIEVIKNYSHLPPILCYPGQLNQVFMNVLANAIDALDETVAGLSYEQIEPHSQYIEVNVDRQDKNAIVTIFDNGKGMDANTRERLFDSGFTTKKVGKGTGLGMAISQKIIEEKHGGTITCTSELGQGTKFAIALPLA
ncbi:MAG: hybrid sensor histidine kinase/response regulator [Cyanobacteria bacterium SBLK]|nr:hybrid sensor histidine kinase/response regulator [Cyanobacteria bacterium SBLK]